MAQLWVASWIGLRLLIVRSCALVGSTPVLKIALPSSPLPEHRQLSRPSTRRLAPFRALSSELGSKTKAQFPEPFSVLTSTRNL